LPILLAIRREGMTKFDRFIKELDQAIVNCKKSDSEEYLLGYAVRYGGDVTGRVVAGVQIFLPPTTGQDGRLLYVSTSMRVYFGEIAPILDSEECAAHGLPEEDAAEAEAGAYGAFRVVGKEGLRNLVAMATDKLILSATALNSMPSGFEPLGLTGLNEVMADHDTTCTESEQQNKEVLEDLEDMGILEADTDLESWAATQRKLYAEGELPDWKITRIERISGWSWD
jgi:hypothetical protein